MKPSPKRQPVKGDFCTLVWADGYYAIISAAYVHELQLLLAFLVLFG